MPAPYPIGDQRALVDYTTNNNTAPPVAASGWRGQQKSIIATTAAISNTETAILNKVILPGITQGDGFVNGTIQAGTVIKVTLFGTSTSTAANTTTFNVYFGTTGTIASDTLAFAVTTAAAGTSGTAVPFMVALYITIRSIGTSATGEINGVLNADAATAIGGADVDVYGPNARSNAFNTTTADFITVSTVSAASTTANTFQQASIEVLP